MQILLEKHLALKSNKSLERVTKTLRNKSFDFIRQADYKNINHYTKQSSNNSFNTTLRRPTAELLQNYQEKKMW